MDRNRGFEIITKYSKSAINLPQRKTKFSAGYDLETAENVVLPAGQVTIIPTGLKVYMQQDEFLAITIRSGMAAKHSLTLINSQGIIDADYYNNADNEGHIMLAVVNLDKQDMLLQKGTRVAQGIFYKYLTTDNDQAGEVRAGGYGSTGQ